MIKNSLCAATVAAMAEAEAEAEEEGSFCVVVVDLLSCGSATSTAD